MNKQTNVVMDDGWVHPLAKTLPSLISNLFWNVVMDDWNLNEESLGKYRSTIAGSPKNNSKNKKRKT